MYQLTENKIAEIENFYSSLEESMVKSKVEVLLSEIKLTGRIKEEQMASLVSLATHFPIGVQSFSQYFALSVKNNTEIEITVVEKKKEVVSKSAPLKKK
jgi:hypothetical protein